MTTREPEWDDEQRDILLALEEYRRGIGPNGESLFEATSIRADPAYQGPGKILYFAHGPFTNYAERARLNAVEAYRKEAGEKANLNGMYWTVEKKSY